MRPARRDSPEATTAAAAARAPAHWRCAGLATCPVTWPESPCQAVRPQSWIRLPTRSLRTTSPLESGITSACGSEDWCSSCRSPVAGRVHAAANPVSSGWQRG